MSDNYQPACAQREGGSRNEVKIPEFRRCPMDVQDHPLFGASGLTDEQAKEVHGYFMTLTIVYVAIALVAHYLMWIWRPWLGG